MNRHYGPRFRMLHWGTDQMLTTALAQMNLTSSQGRILGYIVHAENAPCPKDIEDFFGLSHPSVSGTLSRMKEKGFIEFRPDETDHRSKRIHLLPKGRECHSQILQSISKMESSIVSGFTPEEEALFSQLLDRAMQNIGLDCCHHKKEEDKE